MSKPTAPKQKDEAPRGVIRDRGYQPYTGKLTSEAGRWALIAKRMLRMSARQPWVIVMLILSVLPALVYAVAMYFKARMFAAGIPGVDSPDSYVFDLIVRPYGTMLLAFLTALFAGGGAIADDARGGAFQFYFARPVTREQYLLGKLAPPVVLVAAVACGPSVLVAILRLALARDTAEAITEVLLPFKAFGLGFLEALALGVPVVALSSLSRGRGYVQGGFAALFALPWILGRIFSSVTRSPWPDLLSIPAHLRNLGRALFDVPLDDGERALPLWVSAAVLAALIAGSAALIRRRLDTVEVIAS
jgi:ABC-type transport system involved in multi-copper enzyme maturation permease subunit